MTGLCLPDELLTCDIGSYQSWKSMGYIVFSGCYYKMRRTRFVETRRARTLDEAHHVIRRESHEDDWYQILDDSTLEIIDAGEPRRLLSTRDDPPAD